MLYGWFFGSLRGYVAVELIRHLLWDGAVFIHLLIELQTVIFIEDKL